PAARVGRFAKSEKGFKASAMTRTEAQSFLSGVLEVCPDSYGLFLTPLRAGLRKGELIALKWGDIQFATVRKIATAIFSCSATTLKENSPLRRVKSRAASIFRSTCALRCWICGTSACSRLSCQDARVSTTIWFSRQRRIRP